MLNKYKDINIDDFLYIQNFQYDKQWEDDYLKKNNLTYEKYLEDYKEKYRVKKKDY